jgi:hypothetical protein
MSPEEHLEQHVAQHVALDNALLELWSDFARHFPRALPQDTTVGQLMTWSLRQLREPTDPSPDGPSICAHCGELVENPGSHVCEGRGQAAVAPTDRADRWMDELLRLGP